MRAQSKRTWPWAAWGVFGLTIVGAVFRILTYNDSLFGDELSTHAAVTLADGPADVIRLIRADETLLATGSYVIELTPPLYFLLAWVSAQVGDASEAIRVPALIAGILTVPLVYLVGLRTVGPTSALFATALAAGNPSLIYQSGNARAYGLAAFLVMLTTLALLKALEDARLRWWIAYGAGSAAVIYSHYTAAVVLALVAAWGLVFHRSHYKAIVLANVGAAIAFLPWLGEFLDDRASPYNLIAATVPFSWDRAVDVTIEWVVGAQLAQFEQFPGNLAAGLILAGGILALAGGTWRLVRLAPADRGPRIPPGPALAVVLAVSTPLGLAVYSALGPDVFEGYFIISSPGLMLVLGMLLTAPRMPLRALAAALMLTGFTIAWVGTVSDYGQRPDYKGVAEFLEDHTSRDTPVLERTIFNVRDGPLTQALALNLPDRRIMYPVSITEAVRRLDGSSFALVLWLVPAAGIGPQTEPIPRAFELTTSKEFLGQYQLGAYVYERR